MLRDKCINIEVTNICNASCIMCPREKYKHNLQNMNFELFKKIVNNAVQMGVKRIIIGGFGDPFCDILFVKRLAYIKDNFKNIEVATGSNGYGMKKEFLNPIIRYVDEIDFSFYGMDKETYERIHRGSVKFDTTKNNILRLIGYKKLFKKSKPYIIMRFLILSLNKHQLDEFITFWKNKADEVMVWRPHNYLDGRSYRVLDKKNFRSCGRPFSDNLNVSVDGKVTMCCFDYNKSLVIGDLRKESIQDILNGKKLKKLREIHKSQSFNGHLCGRCDQLNLKKEVLVFSTNKNRKVGQSNNSNINYIKKLRDEEL